MSSTEYKKHKAKTLLVIQRNRPQEISMAKVCPLNQEITKAQNSSRDCFKTNHFELKEALL